MGEPLLRLEKVAKKFDSVSKADVTVLSDIDLQVVRRVPAKAHC
jgi:hypothetical protein